MEYSNYIYKWNSKTESLTKEPITREERISLIEGLLRFPGDMKLDKRIFKANELANNFLSNKVYTNAVKNSLPYREFWDRQKEMCYAGLLIDEEYYITGDFYWFLNFIIILDKVKKDITFPRIFDTQMWLAQLVELAELTYKFTAIVKKRQIGVTLFFDAKILKRFYFEKGFSGKIVAWDEKWVRENWKILNVYKEHLNAKTAWKRNLDPGISMNWYQRLKMKDGSYRGLFSSLKGLTFKNNPSAVVSGKVDEIYVDESGIAPNLDELIEFGSPALTFGDITTGNLHMAGAVGNLKDCKALEACIKNPGKFNVLSIPNIWEDRPEEQVGIFIPEYYSYGTCIDEFGNSLIEKAKVIIEEKAEEERKKSFKAYQIYRSQRPCTISDAFASRDENIFPTDIIEPHYRWLEENYKPLEVEITKSTQGFSHRIANTNKNITDFPVTQATQKDGAICILEPPISNPPRGLYYAGVDTITPIRSSTSNSLQSIHIFKAAHQIEGEYSEEKLVAWYTGRCLNPYESFEKTLQLIEYYNAWACIESNNRNFIEWMIRKKKTGYMMKRSQLPLTKDLILRSTVDSTEYGMKMTTDFKKFLNTYIIEYLIEEIGESFDKDGVSKTIFGATKVKDMMVLKEMLEWTPRRNVDRIISFGLALFASRSNTSRGYYVNQTNNSEIPKNSVSYKDTLRNTALIGNKINNINLGF